MLKFFMLNKVQESDFDSYITVIEIPSIVQVFFFLYVLMDDKLRGPFLLDLTNMVQQNDTNKTRACARGAVDSILKVQRSDAFYFLKALFFFFFFSAHSPQRLHQTRRHPVQAGPNPRLLLDSVDRSAHADQTCASGCIRTTAALFPSCLQHPQDVVLCAAPSHMFPGTSSFC